MAEDLTDYMREVGIRVKYLHSDVDTLERTEDYQGYRLDVFDVLVGINLLRRDLIFRRLHLWRFWMRTRKGSCVVGDFADSDYRPCSEKCGGTCYHVRGYCDRVHADGDR